MDKNMINMMFDQIKSSADFKDRLKASLSSTENSHPKTIMPIHKKMRWMLTGSILAIAVICLVVVLFNPLSHLLTGGPFDYDDQVSSLVELNEKTYVMKRDGNFYELDQNCSLKTISNLPSDHILTDGEDLFYSDNNKIYSYNSNTGTKSFIWKGDIKEDIRMDYINKGIIIFHSGNHYNYTLIDRATGETKKLISRDDAGYFTLADANDQYMLFIYDYYDYGQIPYVQTQAMFVLDLATRGLEQIYEGPVQSARISGDNVVYALPQNIERHGTDRYSSIIISINLSNQVEQEIDLASISLTKIQSFDYSNGYLFIATDERSWQDIEHENESKVNIYNGTLYKYDIETDQFAEIAKIGYVYEIIASSEHICFYDRSEYFESKLAILKYND